MVVKFLEQFVLIMRRLGAVRAATTPRTASSTTGSSTRTGNATPIQVQTLVGVIPALPAASLPLAASESVRQPAQAFRAPPRQAPARRRPAAWPVAGEGDERPAARLDGLARTSSRGVLATLFDEEAFLSPHGLRSLSKRHEATVRGARRPGRRDRLPAGRVPDRDVRRELQLAWTGVVPTNYLVIRALLQYDQFFGDDFTVEYPTGSGKKLSLGEVAGDLADRLVSIWLPDPTAGGPCNGASGHPRLRPRVARQPAVLRVLPRRPGPGSAPATRPAGPRWSPTSSSTRPHQEAEGGTRMHAVTVEPGVAGSARLDDVPEPDQAMGSVLVEALGVGVCGTDVEIAGGLYGWAPPGEERLILGHESLGRVIDPGPTGLAVGDHVVGDRATTGPGAVPELRRRRVGHVLQRRLHRARHQAGARVHVGAVADRTGVRRPGRREPRSCSACCWSRRPSSPRRGSRSLLSGGVPSGIRTRVLVVGAGPIGLLAALIGVQRRRRGPRARPGHQRPEAGPGGGARRHLPHGGAGGPGVQSRHRRRVHRRRSCWSSDAAAGLAPGGIVCLTGRSPPHLPRPRQSTLATDAVLKNLVVFGSVNANRRHYYRAAKVLAEGRPILARAARHPTGRTHRRRRCADQDVGRHQGRHGVHPSLRAGVLSVRCRARGRSRWPAVRRHGQLARQRRSRSRPAGPCRKRRRRSWRPPAPPRDRGAASSCG